MIQNRKTVKGKLGKTRPQTTDFKSIANKKKKNTTKTVKSNRPTDARTKTLRKVLKEKQKLAGKGLGQANQAFLGGSAKQTPVSPKKKPTGGKMSRPGVKKAPKKTFKKITPKAGEYRSGNVLKNIVENQRKVNRMKAGGKTSKYRMAGGGKTSKYRMAGGGKTSKYRMKGGGKTSKYMAKGGKTSKYMARGGRAK